MTKTVEAPATAVKAVSVFIANVADNDVMSANRIVYCDDTRATVRCSGCGRAVELVTAGLCNPDQVRVVEDKATLRITTAPEPTDDALLDLIRVSVLWLDN